MLFWNHNEDIWTFCLCCCIIFDKGGLLIVSLYNFPETVNSTELKLFKCLGELKLDNNTCKLIDQSLESGRCYDVGKHDWSRYIAR